MKNCFNLNNRKKWHLMAWWSKLSTESLKNHFKTRGLNDNSVWNEGCKKESLFIPPNSACSTVSVRLQFNFHQKWQNSTVAEFHYSINHVVITLLHSIHFSVKETQCKWHCGLKATTANTNHIHGTDLHSRHDRNKWTSAIYTSIFIFNCILQLPKLQTNMKYFSG